MKKPIPKQGAKAVKKEAARPETDKTALLAEFVSDPDEQFLTSNQGLRIRDDQNSLRAGVRGPSLLEDHLLREKITHFDHERIPERVVHARGAAAHGVFESYGTGAAFSIADFLQPGVTTPVFTRISTVAGSRGSSDLARDVRGFAVKFYTQQGVFDLVGNNMPVFFIQDGIKFPDLIHAVKPEPHNEIPQAQSAHDTFWDFASLSTESAHMIMWVMSDRAIPRSLRMMEGFGVHTFRLIDKKGVSRFVKFHWKPVLGMASVLWDEAIKISGADPDFHRRDLWEAIESGAGPEWELGVQVVEEADEFKFGFDLLDPTKLIPEELVPVQKLGKMTLNRNPENYFSETEQVAFCVSHVVPGIDVTNDPLMQARLFSYLDTQLSRLGGPNFHELPINKSIAPVANNQRDGQMRTTINAGHTSYEPNSIGGGCPFQAGAKMGGFVSFPQPVEGVKIRDRSESFRDHFSQATMFYNSQTPIEQQHIIDALRFELGKCEIVEIRERMVGVLEQIDGGLAKGVADGLGIKLPVKLKPPMNHQVAADADSEKYQPPKSKPNPRSSPALSIIGNLVPGVKTRKVAILVADGFDAAYVKTMMTELTAAGAVPKIVATHGGMVDGMKVDFSLNTVKSVLFDALYIPGGEASISTLATQSAAALFVLETYKHCKAICASGEGCDFVRNCLIKAGVASKSTDKVFAAANGVVISDDGRAKDTAAQFIEAMSKHRTWDRVKTELVIA